VTRLSKSRLLSFLQCPRKLWLEVHSPQIVEQDAARLARFEAGHRVGAIARTLYTESAVLSGASVEFETQYVHDQVVIRTDVIERPGLFGGGFAGEAGTVSSGPRVVEVKSASQVSMQHVIDCAIQAWAMQGAGDRPGSISVAHIDGQFTYAGGGDYRGLLKESDVTARVEPILAKVSGWARDAQAVLTAGEPVVAIGTRCNSPQPCPFVAHCWPQVQFPLTALPNLGKHLDEYVHKGYADLRDVPEGELHSVDAVRVWRATRDERAEVSDTLREELGAIPYPRYYLDFETLGPCIPIWAGTRPNQAIPYQWSVHIERAPGAELEHLEYLDLSGKQPANGVTETLLQALNSCGDGPVLTYSSYERTCLRTLAAFVPARVVELEALERRLVDMLPIVRRGYYSPSMQGSWSIKAVLPAVAPSMRYESLGEVREGLGAERAYLEAIDPATTAARREAIRRELLRYCAFDTLAMVTICRLLG